MHKLKRVEWIAVVVGLCVFGYVFFGTSLMAMFGVSQPVDGGNGLPSAGFTSEDTSSGDGDTAEVGDSVTVHYTGSLTDGTVFDSSYTRGEPIEFTLGVGQVIRGWDEGLVGMRVGGKRVLRIAPDYGYGSYSVGVIPSNSHLIFEVELVDVEKP